ncbi:glycosyltransferase [Enterobacter cloacae]|uniref:glycosyltransferase family 2 protein n=3 Tax=Enterobacter cloacae TaxID=550 RepID=UPI0020067A47|nr:glycosyltransferase family 2 protein [Enterobacter cloacae]MCK6709380.1 glycosyltransferase [Enterobacter cloacae]
MVINGMNNAQPLVSIITATYNSERFILHTFESIKNQSYENWEWIITDDCSNDSTLQILFALQENEQRIKIYKNEENSGAAVSRNNSLEHAQGDFIAFIDSDDIWYPDKLEKQLAFMGTNIDFSFTSFEMIDESGLPYNRIIDQKPLAPLDYKSMLKKTATLGCSTVILRASGFNEIKMPLIRTGQDYATWLKLLKTNKKACLLPQVLTKYRIVKGSISRNKVKKALRQWEIYRRVEGINILSSSYYFLHYALKAVFR